MDGLQFLERSRPEGCDIAILDKDVFEFHELCALDFPKHLCAEPRCSLRCCGEGSGQVRVRRAEHDRRDNPEDDEIS